MRRGRPVTLPLPHGERAGVRGMPAEGRGVRARNKSGHDGGRWKAGGPPRPAMTAAGGRPESRHIGAPSSVMPGLVLGSREAGRQRRLTVWTPEQVRGDNRGDSPHRPLPALPASGRGEDEAGSAGNSPSPPRGEGRGEGGCRRRDVDARSESGHDGRRDAGVSETVSGVRAARPTLPLPLPQAPDCDPGQAGGEKVRKSERVSLSPAGGEGRGRVDRPWSW